MKALDGDRLGAAQAAWRALSRGERREFLRWAQAFQESRKRQRADPIEKDLSVAMAKMDFAEPG